MTAQSAADPRHARIDRLLDAVDLLREDRRPEAIRILRELIREDGDFEDAWLWMSVAVDSVDQSAVCLDNVLRVNPANAAAAGALSRMRGPELQLEQQRKRLRFWRDLAYGAMWLLVVTLLYTLLFTFVGMG
ncbi:MAG TPA: hypothetical protein PLQ56_08705 [Aggregatilineales bacterium]|nr:hypothetical protein [Aggregatilineales bacterium]